MESTKRAAAGSPRSVAIHPLLLPPEEAVHQLSDEGAERVEADADLAPGHDCCAVCAGPCEPCVICTSCERVQYCSAQHLADDTPSHAAVCLTLRYMRQAESLPGRQPAAADPPASAAVMLEHDGTRPGLAEPNASTRPTAITFHPPHRSKDGWEHVVPKRFRVVYPGKRQEGDEQAAGERLPARKKARKVSTVGEDAATDAQKRSGEHTGLGTEPTPTSAASDADVQLELASELADRTAILSYAYTAAFALRSTLATRNAAGEAATAHQPLELVVLGAAGDAELAELASWQVIATTLDQDVRILFVGPEVPDHLAGTEAQQGRVDMRFLQCTYEEALAGAEGIQVPKRPDAYLAFNPGFTCPDYEWTETLDALSRTAGGAPGGSRTLAVPEPPCLIVATNTSMEAQMETAMLQDHRWRAVAPASLNPYTSLRVDQSGTLSNDLYRKNAWLVVYRHRADNANVIAGRRRRLGGRNAKAAAKRAARALYDTMVVPIARLLRRR